MCIRDRGVSVHLCSASGTAGIQHSKTLLVDDVLYMAGSANWTEASRSNHEVSALVELTAESRAVVARVHQKLRSTSHQLTNEIVQQSIELRAAKATNRAKSADLTDQHRTAKRFSLARARRSQSRDDVRQRLSFQHDDPTPE